MIELRHDTLVFSFPEVHPKANLKIDFQRTLRIPDDGKSYPLPPGLGSFPVRHVDDYSKTIPQKWLGHGGVMLPMYQSEALWINFSSSYLDHHNTSYPFAIKIAAGKINAVTGELWQNSLQKKPQDYLVAPHQPWLDGYCVEKGLIRQFVALPLGAGYSAEEQIEGHAEHGGLQMIIYPMKRKIFEQRYPWREIVDEDYRGPMFCRSMSISDPDMGLAPGGKMRQEIYDDPYEFTDWDQDQSSRCFAHICNSFDWRAITGETPPSVPFTSKEYTNAGLPWFEYYSDGSTAVSGAKVLNRLKSVFQIGKEKKDQPLPENDSVAPENIIKLRQNLSKDQVREGLF